MITIKTRNTIQKSIIFDAVTSVTCHPTAEEIHEMVSSKHSGISLATVYRNLNQLAEDGKILRVKVMDAPDRYDLTVDDHHHFKCSKCGRVYDVEDALEIDLSKVSCKQGRITRCDLLFEGVCNNCL